MTTTSMLFTSLVMLLALGVPIAYALSGAALLAVIAGGMITPMVVVQRLFVGMDSFTLMAIPFFMIAGVLMETGGVSKRLIRLCDVFIGGLPGGLAIVTIIASAFFGALTGSSPATVAAVGGIMVPTMMKMKYDEKFSLATAASAGYLGIIIPPSIAMVSFSLATGASIGSLFMAGFIPGIILALSLSIVAYVIGRKMQFVNHDWKRPTGKEAVRAVWDAIPALLMPVIILGGIYGGIFTPTEAAAVAIFYGLIVGMFIYRELKIKDLFPLFMRASVSSAKVMFIIAGAMALGFIMTREMIPVRISEAILNISGGSVILFLLLVNLMLLVVGTFMETNAAILIIAPVLLPVVNQLNINLIHFGLIMVINLGIGMITPPLGMNLVVASSISGAPVKRIINKYFMTYLFVSIGILFLFTYWPEPILFLPRLLGR